MLFSSLTFIFLFLPLFFLTYFAFKGRAARNTVLLGFSLLFYAWGEPLYVLLMLFSIAVNYFFALGIEKKRGKAHMAKLLLIAAVIVNLSLIGVFKYSGFFISTLNSVTGLSIPVPMIELPIGISFYTFQILSYVIDVYRETVPAQKNILFLGAYLAAFPQLIAGPVVRYETVAAELVDRSENAADFAAGLRRFIAGLAKKVLIANTMALTCDSLLGYSAADYGIIGGWIIALSYTLQIYFDFSGYSDMAIGLGRMMGFKYLENFDYPYTAKSVTGFWRKWHISLSSFFRDYVYIPLGGSRVSKPRWILNMAIVWALTGLWHGASYTFILWGVYYGVLLVCEKLLWGSFIERIPILGHIYTFFVFVTGWVLFRCETLSQTGELLGSMIGLFGGGGSTIKLPVILQSCNFDLVFVVTFIIGAILSTPIWKKAKPLLESKSWGRILIDVSAVAALIICVVALEINSYNPFIYFRF